MATFTGNIQCRNGYSSGQVTVNLVHTQAAAKKALEARYPGAFITSVRQTSIRD
jgi:hypothetical protein